MIKPLLLGVLLILLIIPALRELYYFLRWKSMLGKRDDMEWSRWLQSVRAAEVNGECSQF